MVPGNLGNDKWGSLLRGMQQDGVRHPDSGFSHLLNPALLVRKTVLLDYPKPGRYMLASTGRVSRVGRAGLNCSCTTFFLSGSSRFRFAYRVRKKTGGGWPGGSRSFVFTVLFSPGAFTPFYKNGQNKNWHGSLNSQGNYLITFKRNLMLRWTVIFLIVAIIAAIFGFGGIAAGAAGIAKILFFIFLVLFVLSLIFGRSRSTL